MLDWSSKNVIGIGLKEMVYLFKNEVKENNVVELFRSQDSYFSALSFSPNGQHLATGDIHGNVMLFDLSSEKIISQQKHETDRISCLSWMSDDVFSSGCTNGQVNNLDMRTKSFTKNLRAHSEAVCGLTWNKEENILASGGGDHKVNVWDFRRFAQKRRQSPPELLGA